MSWQCHISSAQALCIPSPLQNLDDKIPLRYLWKFIYLKECVHNKPGLYFPQKHILYKEEMCRAIKKPQGFSQPSKYHSFPHYHRHISGIYLFSRPPRQLYSHSASVGNRFPAHVQNATASFQDTWRTGWSILGKKTNGTRSSAQLGSSTATQHRQLMKFWRAGHKVLWGSSQPRCSSQDCTSYDRSDEHPSILTPTCIVFCSSQSRKQQTAQV